MNGTARVDRTTVVLKESNRLMRANVQISEDGTLNLDLQCIASAVNSFGNAVSVAVLARFNIPDEVISSPGTYHRTKSPPHTGPESLSLVFTNKPYDNNYFFETISDRFIIISLAGWEYLTDLPRNNGALYFLCAAIIRRQRVGLSHRERNTGCINDFWHDKRGVDAGMRSAFLCSECEKAQELSAGALAIVKQVRGALDELSRASRAGRDVCALRHGDSVNGGTNERTGSAAVFDVFICHNSNDKVAARRLNKRLQQKGIRTWFDEEQLPPGRPWQELLEQQIEAIKCAAVLVGESGIGPWQDAEIRGFLSEFINRSCPVIPVILKDCDAVPQLPIFLRQFTWVDFRKTSPDPFRLLRWGITGDR